MLLYRLVRGKRRFKFIANLAASLFIGSLAELLVTIPSHLIVSRRPGCLVGLGTMLGMAAGVYVLFWAFGPAILLLYLYPEYRRHRNDRLCPGCEYDLRGADHVRCPECGYVLRPEK